MYYGLIFVITWTCNRMNEKHADSTKLKFVKLGLMVKYLMITSTFFK